MTPDEYDRFRAQQHAAMVQRTNDTWAMGTAAAYVGAIATGHGDFMTMATIVALGEGGNIGHRVYQETGDATLAMQVGMSRAGATGAVQGVGLAALFLAVLGFGMPILGLMGGSSTSWAIPFVVLLWPAWACWKWCRKVLVENERLRQSGRPTDAALLRAGWVHVPGQDVWVRPEPGHSVDDVLRSYANVIEVEGR